EVLPGSAPRFALRVGCLRRTRGGAPRRGDFQDPARSGLRPIAGRCVSGVRADRLNRPEAIGKV
ncbi:MAG: hypothetical protein AVDCRST_MAG43-519, partial [uncultured Thermomicrobiales bacterium]